MKNKLIALLAGGCLAVFAGGCVRTIDGHSKTAVPFLKDKIESRYERPADQIVAAARQVLNLNGRIVEEVDLRDKTNAKVLQAKVDTRTVWVKVYQEDPKVSSVITQARTKGGGADIDLASEIDKQIALYLK